MKLKYNYRPKSPTHIAMKKAQFFLKDFFFKFYLERATEKQTEGRIFNLLVHSPNAGLD